MTVDYEALLDSVAADLEWLSPPPVFIGGAVIALFLDSFGRTQMRPTNDVDCIVPCVATRLDFTRLEERLRDHGWHPDQRGPICRYTSPRGIAVDFMTQDPRALGFAGQWYPETVKQSSVFVLSTGREIRVPNVLHLFACKLEAFFDRGMADPTASKDLEDIAALLDGNAELAHGTTAASPELRRFISDRLGRILNDAALMEILESQLPRGGDEQGRLDKLHLRLQALVRFEGELQFP